MTLEASVLRDNSVRRVPEGYEVDVYLAWYRSLSLSCIEDVEVKLNGAQGGRERLRVIRDGHSYTLDELVKLTDKEWFVQDPITVRVSSDTPPETGERAEVEVNLVTRIPYIIIGPEVALTQKANVKREVVVQ